MTRTRAEHVKELDRLLDHYGISMDAVDLALIAAAFADYAIEQGMPVAPVQVEPKVGETLTEATRMVHRIGAVDADGDLWQYDIKGGRSLWYSTAHEEQPTDELIRRYGPLRIVFIPDVEPEAEQKHETTTSQEPGSNGPRWRWKCLCGEVSILYSVREDAESDARWHIRGQS